MTIYEQQATKQPQPPQILVYDDNHNRAQKTVDGLKNKGYGATAVPGLNKFFTELETGRYHAATVQHLAASSSDAIDFAVMAGNEGYIGRTILLGSQQSQRTDGVLILPVSGGNGHITPQDLKDFPPLENLL